MNLVVVVAIGAGIGGVLGYFGKCTSGTCPLTANWWRGAMFGALLGAIVYATSAGNGSAAVNESSRNVTRIAASQFAAEVEKATSPVVVDYLRQHARKSLGVEATQLPIKFEVVDAHPVDAVLEAVRRHRADLVVMGTHGRGGSKRLWLGSVAESVVRQAGVPVFVARQKQHEFIDTADGRAMPKLETILCPVNFSAAARAGLDHAMSVAQQFGARLVSACVVERGNAGGTTEAPKELASQLDGGGHPECEVRVVAGRGQSAASEIVSLASEVKADLVVLGAEPRKLLQTWLWGDTTESVLRHAPAPVLVVPR